MSDSVTAIQRSLSPLLKPFSWVYGGVMRLRSRFFSGGMLHTWEPPVLTVSVGNIGWGGTGKTPLAGWLLGWAEKKNLNPVLLTRGYRAAPPSLPYVVHPEALAEEAGDEPLMLAREHQQAHIVVDPERKRGGRMAVKRFQPDLIILDDGFQHMAVSRHLNLVLLTPGDLTDGWNRVIPAGSWREPKSALKRADAFLIKAGPNAFEALRPYIAQRLGELDKPIFSFQIMPTGVSRVLNGEANRDFGSAPYLLVTGVGAPKQVLATAKSYFGYPPVKHIEYPDHHAFNKNNVRDIVAAAEGLGCQNILCTPKDAVKLGPMATENFWQFDLKLQFGSSAMAGGATFDRWWNRRFASLDLKREDRLDYEAEVRAKRLGDL